MTHRKQRVTGLADEDFWAIMRGEDEIAIVPIGLQLEADAIIDALDAGPKADERTLSRLILDYYRVKIGRAMQQAQHWHEEGRHPLAVHHRVMRADTYFQIVALFDRLEKFGENPFETMRRELGCAGARADLGVYPPSQEIDAYRDAVYVAKLLAALTAEHPRWKSRDGSNRHPQTVDEWDWRKDPTGGEALQRSIRRLKVAIDYDDPRAPDQMALVLRTDLSRLVNDYTHKRAAFDFFIAGWRSDFDGAPTEAGEFFLVRPIGLHPGNGKPYLPTIVQRIDGKLYAPTNELEPLYFGENEADDHPLKTTLEWKSLPLQWLKVSGEAPA